MTARLAGPTASMIQAMSDNDLEAFVAPFAADALVNDHHRQFKGKEAIREWSKEIIDAEARLSVSDVRDHHGDQIVTGTVQGNYAQADFPKPARHAFYFSIRGEEVSQLVVLPVARGNLLAAHASTPEG
jgi:hypothetical protein